MIDIVMKRDSQGRERPQERDLEDRPRVVRVTPKNETLRRYLKHGITKVGFLAEGSAEWPFDQFTKRRIKEGDITVEEAVEAEPQAAEGGPKVIEGSGAKSPSHRKDAPPPPTEGSSTTDPNKTTAPKT